MPSTVFLVHDPVPPCGAVQLPTATLCLKITLRHGEILAIRDAAKKIGQSQLRGCVVYTSGEPCPMCMAACYWARIEKVFYASTIGNIKQYSGCDNQDLYAELMKPAAERKIPVAEFMREKAVEVWIEYSKMAEKCR
jgi:tRNA(Arg) A34 adenosine deaminase TadA